MQVRFTPRAGQFKATEAALRRMLKDASKLVAKERRDLAAAGVRWAKAEAKKEGRQAARIPVWAKGTEVVAGGNRRVGHSHGGRRRRSVPAWKLVFGSEFGARTLKQYKPHLGGGSYWFWKSMEKKGDVVSRRLDRIARTIARRFGRG